MSGSLVLIQETTVSSPQASVSLVGIDSSFEVYKVVINGYLNSTASGQRLRVTVSGTPDTTSNYDRARKQLKTDTSFTNSSNANEDKTYIGQQIGTLSNSQTNAVMYLFNFPNASEYSYATIESAWVNATPNTVGMTSGLVHTVASASDGVQIFNLNGNNIASRTFKLYGLKK